MDKEVLEVALRRLAREQRVERVISTDLEAALAKGENYASDIFRLRARVILGDGRVVSRSYILKKVPQNQIMANHLKEMQAFQIETKIYTFVFKEMERLMEEFEDTEGPLWCNLIHYEPNTSLLLEDLKSSGYRSVQRTTGMDLEHALLAIRAFGRFHGLAKVLEVRGITSKDEYKPYIGEDPRVLKDITYPAVQNMINGIKQYWGPEWYTVADKLNVSFEEFSQIVKKSLALEESEFRVHNHGDCWSNNIMFRYDWQMKPSSVRFLDFQYPHYNTPCMDLSNFLFFSVQPVVRRQNYSCLLENYYESLITTLDRYSYKGLKPSLEEIFNVMGRISIFWTYIFATWYPFLTTNTTETLDVEKLLKTNGKEGINIEVFNPDTVKERMGPDLINLIQNYMTTTAVST